MSSAEFAARKPGRRRWSKRYSLRTLLVMMTVLCVWVAVTSNRANRRQRAVDAFQKHGAEVNFDYQRDSHDALSYSYNREPPGPAWLRGIIGDKYFVTPVRLLAGNPSVVEDLELLKDLPELESLELGPLGMTNRELNMLRPLAKLKMILLGDGSIADHEQSPNFAFLRLARRLTVMSINDPRFTDDAFQHLSRATGMRQLFLQDTSVGDAGLAVVAGMQNLKMLNLARTNVTDLGLSHLAGLPKLEYLCLVGTSVTDAGLTQLAKIPSLKKVELRRTGVTDAGVAELRKSLPQCTISP